MMSFEEFNENFENIPEELKAKFIKMSEDVVIINAIAKTYHLLDDDWSALNYYHQLVTENQIIDNVIQNKDEMISRFKMAIGLEEISGEHAENVELIKNTILELDNQFKEQFLVENKLFSSMKRRIKLLEDEIYFSQIKIFYDDVIIPNFPLFSVEMAMVILEEEKTEDDIDQLLKEIENKFENEDQ